MSINDQIPHLNTVQKAGYDPSGEVFPFYIVVRIRAVP